MTFDEIVIHYIDHCREGARSEMRFFQAHPSLAAAVRHAMHPGGRKHSHQYRISPTLLDEAERRLLGMPAALERAESFVALHRLVEREAGALLGIGELAVYDIAHRLGAFLKLELWRVYLHRGTREGAAALGIRGKSVEHRLFPPAFLRLTPAEVEGCLCIYKDHIQGRRSRAIRTASTCLPGESRARSRC